MCPEREMGSREKDQTARHQPLLSSLLVRPPTVAEALLAPTMNLVKFAGIRLRTYAPIGTMATDVECVQVLFLLCVVGMHITTLVQVLNPLVVHQEVVDLAMGKKLADIVITLPLMSVGDGGRFLGKGHDQSALGPGPGFEGLPRKNPNVRPREGDWICSDPSCKNLNFARREECNSCNKRCYASPPRRGYLMPPLTPRQRVPPPPLYHSPGRTMNGSYRSSRRGWLRGTPRDFRIAAGPLQRHEARFPDPLMRSIYPADVHPRDRYRYDRPVLPDWGRRDHGRHTYFNERRGHRRRVVSPPPAAVSFRGWASASHIRDRSRSPGRGRGRGGEEPKDHQCDMYGNRRRDDRRGVGRDAF